MTVLVLLLIGFVALWDVFSPVALFIAAAAGEVAVGFVIAVGVLGVLNMFASGRTIGRGQC